MGYTIPIFEKDEEYPYELVLEWFPEYMLSQKKSATEYIMCSFCIRKRNLCVFVYFYQKKHRKNNPKTNKYKWDWNFNFL